MLAAHRAIRDLFLHIFRSRGCHGCLAVLALLMVVSAAAQYWRVTLIILGVALLTFVAITMVRGRSRQADWDTDVPTAVRLGSASLTGPRERQVLVAPKKSVGVVNRTGSEKWLVYCPGIAADTLLVYVRRGDSYSLRSYGGSLGVDTRARHAAGAHSAADFERQYAPDKWREVTRLRLPVTDSTTWKQVIADEWLRYRAARPP